MSSQMACPDGASAECASDMPSASPTTCDVAAVPRNWQPPPGDAHARQPASAASSSVISPCANRAPIVCTRPASSPSAGEQRDAARYEHARQIARRGQRHHHRRQALVARRDAEHAAPRRQRSDQAPEDRRRVVPVRQAVEHRASCPASGRRRGRCTRRQTESRRCSLKSRGRGLHQQPDFPVPRVIPERDRRSVGRADAAVRARGSGTPFRRAARGPSPCPRSASSRTGRQTAAREASPPSTAARRQDRPRAWERSGARRRRNHQRGSVSWWVAAGCPAFEL